MTCRQDPANLLEGGVPESEAGVPVEAPARRQDRGLLAVDLTPEVPLQPASQLAGCPFRRCCSSKLQGQPLLPALVAGGIHRLTQRLKHTSPGKPGAREASGSDVAR